MDFLDDYNTTDLEYLEEEFVTSTAKFHPTAVLDCVPSTSRAPSSKKDRNTPLKRKNARKIFSTEQKRMLAGLVLEKPAIWKIDEKLHHNSHAVTAGWNYLSKNMGETVENCKAIWKSLKNSMRYHTRGKEVSRSGSAADTDFYDDGDSVLINEESAGWEFNDCMSFLEPPTRATFSTHLPSTDTLPSAEVTETSGEDTSNYSYQTQHRRTRKFKDTLAESASTISNNISELLTLRKQITSALPPPPMPELKHFSMLANLDRMLQKLPDNKVEELNMKYTQLAYDEIQKLQ